MSKHRSKRPKENKAHTEIESSRRRALDADVDSETSERAPEPPNWVEKGTFVVLIFAFFAACYAGYEAHRLADLTDVAIIKADDAAAKQREIAVDTEQRQLRAYVMLSSIGGTHGLNIDQDKTSVLLDNFGLTPAKNVKFFSNWEFLPFDENLPANFAFAEKDGCESKGAARPVGGIPIFPKNPLPAYRGHCPGEFEKLMQADRNILNAFFYGYVEYQDIFETNRRSNFCFLWKRAGAVPCDRHNEIDPDENTN